MSKLNVDGTSISYHVTESGMFVCDFKGKSVSRSTLKSLRSELSKILKEQALSIPFVFYNGDTFFGKEILDLRHGTIVGQGSKGYAHVQYKGREGISTENIFSGSHNTSGYLSGSVDVKELERLYTAWYEAEIAFHQFTRENALNLDWNNVE